MFSNKPNKKLKDFLSFLHKKHVYNRDLLNEKQLQQFSRMRTEAEALAQKTEVTDKEADHFIEQEGRRLEKILPREAFLDGWAENVEVFFVAIVIALGIRSYILQPFSIPTDSMKPTLWGIYREPRTEPPPGILTRVVDFAVQGKNYHYLVAKETEVIRQVTEYSPLAYVGLGKFRFLTFTDIKTDHQTYTLRTGADNIPPEQIRKLQPGSRIVAGQVMANFSVAAGDHLFVNKMVYHFFKPQRGDVFVFTTHGIREIEARNEFSQYYIKRCVGTPGDQLEIKPPHLLVNGEILDSRAAFERIYSMQNGYNGYVYPGGYAQYLAGPRDTYQVPKDCYWAMGDNSKNSFDSRGWGPVVRQNLVGTGLWVYWPFTKRWGPVN